MLILGATFVVIDGAALVVYSLLAQRGRSWLEGRQAGALGDRICGVVFLGAAGALARVSR